MPKTTKEPTLREIVVEQLHRLSKTRGFPDNKLAIQDYCNALEVMETFEGVRSLMDDLVRTEWISMPSAATVRSMAYERMKETLARRRACELCDGVGVQTIWKLVTYQGKSYTVKNSERIPVNSQEAANDFARDVEVFLDVNPSADRQQVLSAAKSCECRRVTA